MSAEEDASASPEGWNKVAEVAHRYEADLMAGRLRESGIDALVIDKSFHQEPIPNARFLAIVRVYVPADRAEDARRILENPGVSESREPGSKS
jgi:hypothetical protein